MMCDRELWSAQIRGLLADYDVRSVAIDGHDSIAAIASSVLRALPQQFSLAGLSMGGIVAFEMVRQAPERVVRLALLDTTFKPDTPEKIRLRDEQMRRVRFGELTSVLRDELKPNYLARCHQHNPVLLDSVVRMGLRNGEEVFLRQSRALQQRVDSGPLLGRIACPTLVLCGREDRLCPVATHEEMAERIPGATLQILEACGHLSPMEQPDAVTGLLHEWMQAA
jgi:pimeloyl-ACP methyl ester carboxylesterase